MRMFYNMLVFFLCLQFSAYLLPKFMTFPSSTPLQYDPNQIASLWSIDNVWNILKITGAASIGIAVVSLLFNIGTYAIFAMIIVALGLLYKPVNDFIQAIPNFIHAIMPPDMPSVFGDAIFLVVTAIVAFAGFMFLLELITQRNIT